MTTVTALDQTARRRTLATAAVLGMQLMLTVDASVVNLALPVVQRDLAVSATGLTWVVNAYLIAYGGILLLAGRIGDLIGRRQVLVAGVGVFTAASLGCALARDVDVLVAMRFLQGIGGGTAAAVILAVVSTMYPEPGMRAKAMSAYMFTSVGGGSAGLLLGGLVTQATDWHWIFALNLPVGVLVAPAIWRLVPPDPRGRGQRESVDVVGALLMTASTTVGAALIVRVPIVGWTASSVVMAVAVVGLSIGFCVSERVRREPIIPVRLLRNRRLLATNLVRSALAVGLYGFFFFGALYFEKVRGYGAFAAGAAFLPQTVVVAALSLGPTAWLISRYGEFKVLLGGLVALLAGLSLLAGAGVHTSYFPLVWAGIGCMGVGVGAAFVPLLTIALAGVDPQDAGSASALINAFLYISGAIGLAVLGAVAESVTRSSGPVDASALVAGYRAAYLVAAACVVLGILVTVICFGRPVRVARRTDRDPTAEPGLADASVASGE